MAEANNKGLPIDVTADTNFMQEISTRITIAGRLPFNVPMYMIPIHINDAVKFFYKNYYDATTVKRYIIRNSDLDRSNSVPKAKLVDWITAVIDVQPINGSSNSNTLFSRSPSLLMMNAFKFNDFLNGTFSYKGVNETQSGEYTYQGDAISDGLVSLYSASLTTKMMQQFIEYKYNEMNNELSILGAFHGDLMIEVTEGIELKDLYNNDLFTKYVTGHCLVNLKSILGTFAFQMPGDVTINYEEYSDRGDKLIDEVKLSLEEEMPGDIFIIV
jgi:hypothetical protein